MRRKYIYIHQNPKWPLFSWNNETLQVPLGKVRNLQGRLAGKMEALGFSLRSEALLETLTLDVLKSTEIEGDRTGTVINSEVPGNGNIRTSRFRPRCGWSG
jgi:Fic family protein